MTTEERKATLWERWRLCNQGWTTWVEKEIDASVAEALAAQAEEITALEQAHAFERHEWNVKEAGHATDKQQAIEKAVAAAYEDAAQQADEVLQIEREEPAGSKTYWQMGGRLACREIGKRIRQRAAEKAGETPRICPECQIGEWGHKPECSRRNKTPADSRVPAHDPPPLCQTCGRPGCGSGDTLTELDREEQKWPPRQFAASGVNWRYQLSIGQGVAPWIDAT